MSVRQCAMRLLLPMCATLPILIGSFSADAEFQVVDDKHVLRDMKTWVAQKPFAQAMACGTTAAYDSLNSSCQVRCTDQWCQSRCENTNPATARFSVSVAECKGDVANVFSDRGHTIAVSKTDFEASSSTYLVPFLKQLGIFYSPEGTVHLTWSFPESVQYIDDGNMRTLQALRIRAELEFDHAKQREQFDIVVTGDLDGSREILSLGSSDGRNEFMYLRGTIFRSNHP